MSTLLYINAHPLDVHESFSAAVGERFLDAYRAANPSHPIARIDLYRADVPLLDADVLRGWNALRAGEPFDALAPETQRKLLRLGELVDGFLAADKYVFVSPMWNFSYPPAMKAYLDAVAVAGKTFQYTPQGPVGLVAGKALHIQASGGVYSEGPAAGHDFGHAHLAATLRFFGIADVRKLAIEGHAQHPERRDAIAEAALRAADELARIW